MIKNISRKPIALVTGVSRKIGIGSAIAKKMAESGWDIAITYWQDYDKMMDWGSDPHDIKNIQNQVLESGARMISLEADLADINSPASIFDTIEKKLGSVTALIINHCYCIESDILETSPESFDLHFAINTRATWLLIKEYVSRFNNEFGKGRIIAITSDHTAGNLPYGASKGAMDRIVLASAIEFKSKGITANVVNPGATDTGWMTEDLKSQIKSRTPLNSIGMPADCANLVTFLCSVEGGWINGQMIYSNGGFV